MQIEWQGKTTMLVRNVACERGPNFPWNWRRSAKYYEVRDRRIDSIFVHQTAGSPKDGGLACSALAEWIVSSPRFAERNGKQVRTGGGRGFPGVPYTFMVPHRPDVREGKFVVYRMWDDEWVTWHTRGHNKTGVGVAFAGSFATRHSPKFSDRHPTDQALAAGEELIDNYLIPRYGLAMSDVRGHFDAGKPTCPGDALEAWVRRQRGETVSWMDERSGDSDRRPLSTNDQRIEAMVDLGRDGFALRTREGFRMAVESVQEEAGIVVDGVWGRNTESAVRRLLAAPVSRPPS